ncbi:hypothetical protein OAX11_04755 [Flavobacteriaceae bacterium]|nr:hypothetical protein [Flavobacteriaceae bacterium]
MKYLILVILSFTYLISFGQKAETSFCETKTVEILLAYEYKGQLVLDDMILKSPELIQFDNSNISSNNYKKGIYHFYSTDTNFKKLEECNINVNKETVFNFENPFHNIRSKVVSIKNKAFAGKGTTMIGDESVVWGFHEFKYKLFKVKFNQTYIGLEKRTIINVDRKKKNEPETITIECPIFVMTKIIDISIIQ